LKSLIRYLFPPTRKKQRLPLLPLEFSSDHYRSAMPDDEESSRYRLQLIGFGLARTQADAQRVLDRYPNAHIREIVKAEKRQRRRQPRIIRAWRRLKRLW
jgi:hypothetical protein